MPARRSGSLPVSQTPGRPFARSGLQMAHRPGPLLCDQRQVAGCARGASGRLHVTAAAVALDWQRASGFRSLQSFRGGAEDPPTAVGERVTDGPALSAQNLNPSVARRSRSFLVTPGAGWVSY